MINPWKWSLVTGRFSTAIIFSSMPTEEMLRGRMLQTGIALKAHNSHTVHSSSILHISYRLLHSPSLMTAGLWVGCETWCYPGRGFSVGLWIGMLSTAHWLEMLQASKRRVETIHFVKFWQKIGVESIHFPHFCSNIGVKTIQILQRPEKGGSKWRSICSNLQRVSTLPGGVTNSVIS